MGKIELFHRIECAGRPGSILVADGISIIHGVKRYTRDNEIPQNQVSIIVS
jgi:hypothetical protein